MKNGYCCSSGKKYVKMVLIGLKTHFKFFFIFLSPNPSYAKESGQKKPPPPTRCQFQRPLRVGLSLNSFCETQKALSVLMSFPLCYFIATNKLFAKENISTVGIFFIYLYSPKMQMDLIWNFLVYIYLEISSHQMLFDSAYYLENV